jgi:hypothetical protein
MAELLELRTNEPQVVALAYSDGREFPSKIAGAPPQVMFTLVDGRRVFWPQPFADSLRNSGIEANMPFEVVKRETEKGRTQLQFRAVQKVTQPAPRQQDAPAQTLERIYTAPAIAVANAVHERASGPTNTEHRNHTAPASPQSARFMSAYKDAIDVLLEARVYAQRQGLALEIRCEDVRCLAATIMIDAKGGR